MRRDLRRAETGEIQGYQATLATAGGGMDETRLYGVYRDRLQYAIYAADEHLHSMIVIAANSPGVGHTSAPAIDGEIAKPGDLPFQLLNA